MDNKKRSPIDRLLFATFLKGRTSSREILNQRGEISPEENQKIIEETNEIINDDSIYPFISYLSDLLAKSKPSDEALCRARGHCQRHPVPVLQRRVLRHRRLPADRRRLPSEQPAEVIFQSR